MAANALTSDMIDALRKLAANDGRGMPMGVRFPTMTALVRRGLVERDSVKVVERRYSSTHGYDQLQVKNPKGWWMHEYWMTHEGHEALRLASVRAA